MDILSILTGDGGILSFLLLMLFFFIYPRLMVLQMTWKLESQLKELEEYAIKTQNIVAKRINKAPDKKLKKQVSNFMNFFISTPVDVDPYGILPKIEHIMKQSERRFDYFVNSVAPKMTIVEKANLKFGIIGALGVNQIYKVVRHFVITIKKTSNLQLAMILQMSMPMLMKLAKANVKATQAFLHGIPIGDAIGPIVAAGYKTKEGSEIAKDVLLSEEKISGKKVFVMKSKGPGGALGELGHAVERIHKKNKIDYIITIDAAGKLEGETTGDVAEGVGVMMGGIGVERSQIENVAVKHDIPMDGIAIKMSPNEASIPLRKDIYKSISKANSVLERLVKESKAKKILVIGVGNTCGIGNTKKSLAGLEKKLAPIWKKQKKEDDEEKKKEKKWF